MTYDELKDAFVAIHLGVDRCLALKHTLAIPEIVDYAKKFCKVEHIEAVLTCIDVDKLNGLITEISGIDKLARISTLRDATCLPLLRCKQALELKNWDIVEARNYLREQLKPIGVMDG